MTRRDGVYFRKSSEGFFEKEGELYKLTAKKMAEWIKTDGTRQQVSPKEGEAFSLEELQAMVAGPEEEKGTIQYLPLPDGRVMFANDNGRIIGLDLNEEASKLWREMFPVEQYPMNRGSMTIVGNAVVCSPKEAGEEEE